MRNYAKRYKNIENVDILCDHGSVSVADIVNRAYADGKKDQAKADAKLVLREVPCSICKMSKKKDQFCESFGCSSFRELAEEILGKKRRK